MKVYERTEDGVTTRVSVREALAEVNHAMMDGRRDVRRMSSGRTRHDIEYKDGRRVLLVLVDEPEQTAPRFAFRDLVMTSQGPGKVARITNVPRRDGTRIIGYDVELTAGGEVYAQESDVQPFEPETAERPADEHVVSVRGGKVHTMMPGMDGHPYPLCRGGGMNQMLTAYRVVNAPLTCKTCCTYAERRAFAAARSEV